MWTRISVKAGQVGFELMDGYAPHVRPWVKAQQTQPAWPSVARSSRSTRRIGRGRSASPSLSHNRLFIRICISTGWPLQVGHDSPRVLRGQARAPFSPQAVDHLRQYLSASCTLPAGILLAD